MFMLLSPATAPPPNELKNVIALVIAASIRAFSQSNFCSVALVTLFVQLSMNPFVVNVGILLLILFRKFKYLPLIVSLGFVKDCAASSIYGFLVLLARRNISQIQKFLEYCVLGQGEITLTYLSISETVRLPLKVSTSQLGV